MKLPKEGADGLPKDGFDWITLKVIVQGSKGQKRIKFGYFVTMTNVCMKHIYKVIYDLSVYLVTFDLGLPLMVKSRWHTSQGIVSHKWQFSQNWSDNYSVGQKGQDWLIFTYLSILISSIEVLPPSCSLSEVILLLFSNFNGVDWF